MFMQIRFLYRKTVNFLHDINIVTTATFIGFYYQTERALCYGNSSTLVFTIDNFQYGFIMI